MRKILIPFSALVILSYLPMFLSAELVDLFIREDRIYETLSVVFFFVTALLYGLAYFRSGKHRAYLVLALAFFIFAGEEISWGQRILNTGDSELVRSINAQQETNLHNLKWIDSDKGEASFLSAGTLFLMFTLSIWLFIPLIAEASKPAKQFFASFMPIFPWQLFLLMILNFALFFAVKTFLNSFPDYYHHRWMSSDWGITEVLEHDTALILMIIAAYHVFALPPDDTQAS
jgi:hypothetical protein